MQPLNVIILLLDCLNCGQAAFRSPMPSPQAVGFYFCKNEHLFWLNSPIHFSSRIQMGFFFSSLLSSFKTLGGKSLLNSTSVFLFLWTTGTIPCGVDGIPVWETAK